MTGASTGSGRNRAESRDRARQTVAVIGGGLAGLTAALELADAGWAVTLLESRARLGGVAGSGRRGDLPVDTGQHVFLRCCTSYLGLLDRLGARSGVTVQPRLHVPVLLAGDAGPARRARLRRSRLPLPAPAHLAGALLGYPALPPAARLRAVAATRALGRLDPTDPGVDARRFGDWLTGQVQGRAAIEGLWELLTVATLNTPVAEASLALAATVVREGLLTDPRAGDIGWAHVPLGALHDTAARLALNAAGVQVQDRTRVTAVHPSGGSDTRGSDTRGSDTRGSRAPGWTVRTRDGELAAGAVVLAVPPAVAAALLPGLGLDPAALGSSPIVNVHVRYDRVVADFPPDAPFTATVGSPAQWIFDRTRAAGLTGGQYLAVSLSAADQWLAEPAGALQDRFITELARLFPGAGQARILDAFTTREPQATFRQAAGTGRHRPTARTALAGIALAGAWTDTGWPATMEGAVRSGHAAACALLAAPADRPSEVAA